MIRIITALVGALLIAWLLTPAVGKMALKIGAVDKPNKRKVHTTIMPRMGGLAVYAAFVSGVLIAQPLSRPIGGLLAGSTLIVVVGVLDDIISLKPWQKLCGQIVAAVTLCCFGIEVSYVTNPLSDQVIHLGLFSIPLTVLWIVLVTNAFNLIDGLDGLASGVATIAALTLAVTALKGGRVLEAVCALILAAAALGFLRHNFYPARIFLGDTGSMFLGFVLAALSIMGLAKGVTVISIVVPIVILGIPLIDTFFAVIRRLLGHKPVFAPDKEHIHHRLLALGLTHRQVVLAIYLADVMFSLIAIISTMITTTQTFVLLLSLLLVVCIVAQKIGVLGSKTSGQASNQPERQQQRERAESGPTGNDKKIGL